VGGESGHFIYQEKNKAVHFKLPKKASLHVMCQQRPKQKKVTQSHLSSKIPYVLPQQTTAAAAFFGFLTAKWHNTLDL
jgi:hypothetical protein